MALYQSLGRLVTLMFGDAYYAPLNDSLYGVAGYPVTPISKISLGSPAVASADYLVTTVNVADASTTALTLAHTTLDVPRNISAVAQAASSSDAVLNIVGTDIYGNVITESLTLNNATAVQTAQAFKTVTSITPAGGAGKGATALTVGTGNKLGLPVKLNARPDLLQAWHGSTLDGGGLTVVVGSTSANADDRGTIAFTNALDGSEIVVYMAVDASTTAKMVGR
jgi:hypothetical protein